MRTPRSTQILRYLAWAATIVVTLYPLLFMVFAAFKTPQEFTFNFWLPPRPGGFTFDNLREVWLRYKFYLFFRNSVAVSAGASVLTLTLSLLAGYAFARLRFPFSEVLFVLFIGILFLPVFIYIIPLFVQMRRIHLTNSLASLLVVYTFFGLPANTFIARGYFETLPGELAESGLMDGASHFTVFRHIMLPLAKPVVSAILILSFIGNWGEYIWVIVSNTRDTVKTIPAALTYFTTMSNVFWWYQMAALFIAIFPVMLVYLALNRMFIRGMTEGALKA
jgi:ABC-type glycerol-3-phosphate transport system permease component